MKIDFKDGNYIIYLNKYNVINMDFSNTKVLENDLKTLLLRLKKYYKIDIQGYYNITIYIDDYYGAILKIEEDDDYYDCFDDTVALRLKKIKSSFLYEIDDISYLYNFIDKVKININKDKIYIELLKKGSELYEKGKVANEELKHNIEEKMKENITVVYETKDFSKDDILKKIKDMSEEDKKELMSALKDKSKK